MSAITLTPGTLSDVKYPASAQTLLERFANAMYAPTAARTLFAGASMTGAQDGTTLFFDTAKKTLNTYDNSAWRAPLEGNTKIGTSTTAQVLTGVQVSNIGSQMPLPGSTNLVAVTLNVRSTQSRILLRGSIPVATSSVANDTLVAMLSKSTQAGALTAAYQRVPAANALVSLAFEFLDTPGTTGNITYGIRLGSTSSGATLGVNRTADGSISTVFGHLTITAQEIHQLA
jgi:hypothetical protein